MMLFLRLDISYPRFPAGGIDGESTISFGPSLPSREMRIDAHELACLGFQELHKVCNSYLRRDVAEHVHMVRHPPDPAHERATVHGKIIHILVELTLVRDENDVGTPVRAENKMISERCVAHGECDSVLQISTADR